MLDDGQLDHLNTHNLFYTALFGENCEGMVDRGFRNVGEFMHIPDTRKEVDIDPPYTLLGDDTAIFFDFISPGSLTYDEIKRISKYNEIRLRAVEKHINRTHVAEDRPGSIEIDWFHHCTVLREDQYIDHQSGDGESREKLDRLEEESPVATLSEGTSLSLESGHLRNDNLHSLLESGIPVPKTPPSIVYLTRQVTRETLALGICEEMVLGSDLSENGTALDFEDVKNNFGRDFQYEIIGDAFEYLRDIGACRKRREDGKYLFTKYDLGNIMEARKHLKQESVRGRLYDDTDSEDEDMASLDDFF